jgi:(5-formylfuran-3-yl)methyl phosphate synthase
MQLLVSVRSAVEVDPALAGGADIIDAKEPSRGSLGAVSADALGQILAQVPADRSVSVALGDFTDPDDVRASVASLPLSPRSGPIYLKLGFAGVRSPERIGSLIGAAVLAARSIPASPGIVAVAYADATPAETIPPALVPRLARLAGAAGVLLDTHTKNGLGLLEWVEPGDLAAWVSSARRAGLLTALAGALGLAELPLVRRALPDVVGVRGAACEGGREGRVTRERVEGLRRGLRVCETPYSGANSSR